MTRCRYMVVCDIFFFKQKTAYEMRISDWSSDVCSSDLAADRRFNQTRAGLAAFQRLERRCGGAAFLGLSAVRAGSQCCQRHLISLPFHKSNMIVFYRSCQATNTLQTPMGTRAKGKCVPKSKTIMHVFCLPIEPAWSR